MSRLTRLLSVLALSTVLFSACATTVVDDGNADVEGSVATTTTLPIAGTTAELLAEMRDELRGLSAQIAADGDEKATLARIEAIWAIARDDVDATHPELVGPIDISVEMAGTAVRRIRPADADKATQILNRLVNSYSA